MSTFVLVHGAFHGAWCWVKLVPALERRGHRVIAVDLPAQGDDPTPIAECSLAGNAERVVARAGESAEPAILVGHSVGGISISAAAEAAPERFRRLVYLAAFLPRDGDSVASLYAPEAARRPSGPSDYERSADGLGYWPKPEAVQRLYYNGTDPADVATVLPCLRPQPFAVQRAPVRLTPERFGRVPRAYIECVRDNSVPIRLQREMVARSPCDPVITFDTDHSPFFSAPERLADALHSLT